MVLVLGIEHIVLASGVAAVGAALIIALQYLVPVDTGVEPPWVTNVGFVISVISSWVLVVATIWYAMREISRAEAAGGGICAPESLLANILPAKIGTAGEADPAPRCRRPLRRRLRVVRGHRRIHPARKRYDAHRAGPVSRQPVHRPGHPGGPSWLEKIKTSGDSYMIVSGVPGIPGRPPEALADLALDMVDAVAELIDPAGLAGPAGGSGWPRARWWPVSSARGVFYDVWGDAVNVAARMETTDVEGRIQVPQNVYERLKDTFTLEERGAVEVKGKGVMQTWYLVGRRSSGTP